MIVNSVLPLRIKAQYKSSILLNSISVSELLLIPLYFIFITVSPSVSSLYTPSTAKPTITAYPANSKGAVIIFPGGGYVIRADHEGTAYAKWLQSIGLTAFVVEYRVAPYKHPAEISDAMRAVKYVRYYADKYGIDKDKIAVMGSSAGGHQRIFNWYCLV